MITATAPGRVSLFGAPTDLFGGSVLACATRERARCALDSAVDTIAVTVGGRSEVVQSAADLSRRDGSPLDIARAVLAALEAGPGQTPPFHLTAETDIPAPLDGSAALLATITGCLLTHLDLRLNLYEIAELIRRIESDYLGAVRGFEGYYMAVFGGLNFLDFREKSARVPPDPSAPFATVERLDPFVNALPIVAALTGGPGGLPPAAGPTEEHREMARLARDAKRDLLACDWTVFGDLMHRALDLQRRGGSVGPAAAALIAAALGGGADGAVLTGDGAAVVALTFEPERTVQSLVAAGAAAILHPHPTPGLTIAMEVTVP